MERSSVQFVDAGTAVDNLPVDVSDNRDLLFRHFGLIRITTGAFGSMLEWDIDYWQPGSLGCIADRLARLPAPYYLKFYKDGWFCERHDRLRPALRRLEELSSVTGAVSIAHPIFCCEIEPEMVPDFVLGAVQQPERSSAWMVLSEIDVEERFPMIHVGRCSLVARVMGRHWMETGNYPVSDRLARTEQQMTRSYSYAQDRAEPYVEAVLCSVPSPLDGEPFWLGYTRVLYPLIFEGAETMATISLRNQPRPQLIALDVAGSDAPVELLL